MKKKGNEKWLEVALEVLKYLLTLFLGYYGGNALF